MSIFLYILKRVINAIPILIIVSLISFFIIRLSPIDPLSELKLNPAISPQTLEAERVRLGLDLPLYKQYLRWGGNFLKGDLGVSTSGELVVDRLKERNPNTLLLTGITILLTWLVGIPLGIYAALNWRKPADRIITVFTSIGMAIPSFFLCSVIIGICCKNWMVPCWRFNEF